MISASAEGPGGLGDLVSLQVLQFPPHLVTHEDQSDLECGVDLEERSGASCCAMIISLESQELRYSTSRNSRTYCDLGHARRADEYMHLTSLSFSSSHGDKAMRFSTQVERRACSVWLYQF